MNQPTKEQIQWFWEQCPVVKDESNINFAHGYPCYDSLDDLFKYAVPKVELIDLTTKRAFTMPIPEKDGYFASASLGAITQCEQNNDPALALFWAIHQAFGGK